MHAHSCKSFCARKKVTVYLTMFLYSHAHAEYTRLTENKTIDTMKQEKFVWMEINFVLEKNRDHIHSNLSDTLIVVIKQVGSQGSRQAGGGWVGS